MSCQGCTERRIGCHASCESYRADSERFAARREEQRRKNLLNGYTLDAKERVTGKKKHS